MNPRISNIETKVQDIFENGELDAIVHQANCYHTFGAGIAKAIREKFPEAYSADCETEYATLEKLGTFSFADCNKEDDETIRIYNMYSQGGFGSKDRDTSYDAMVEGLTAVKQHMLYNEMYYLGIPYGLGSALAGGSWTIVNAIINSIFEEGEIKVYIHRLPHQLDLK